jgi:hypothetical protein
MKQDVLGNLMVTESPATGLVACAICGESDGVDDEMGLQVQTKYGVCTCGMLEVHSRCKREQEASE